MAGWSTEGRNRRASAVAALISKVSLHTADPGVSGSSNEWSGGSYARQTPVFGSASGGVVGLTAQMDFDGLPLTDAAFVGVWASDSAFLGSAPRDSGDAASNAAGEYSIVQLDIDADGNITAP